MVTFTPIGDEVEITVKDCPCDTGLTRIKLLDLTTDITATVDLTDADLDVLIHALAQARSVRPVRVG